jgi:hypothetical protein
VVSRARAEEGDALVFEKLEDRRYKLSLEKRASP